nr:hypothetical protein [Candidatus Njordarchaeota archaeon]
MDKKLYVYKGIRGDNMDNIENEKFVVLSVIGPHAGETEGEIFRRKIMDITNIGTTFWLIKSYKAKPDLVQQFCRCARAESRNAFAVFIEPSAKKPAVPTRDGARTHAISTAKKYSADRTEWTEFPIGLTPLTGKIDGITFALLLDQLELLPTRRIIDLWNYADFYNQENPITIRQRSSTLCAMKKDMSRSKNKIKSRFRKVVAVGRLRNPYCVWVRVRALLRRKWTSTHPVLSCTSSQILRGSARAKEA